MATVLIVAYLLIVIAMIVVILLQRSEGGGLGMGGGGGGGGGLMSARGSANLLTRTTAILGTLFMATAIGLTIVSQIERGSTSILDRAGTGTGTPASVLDALDAMGTGNDDLVLPGEIAPPAEPEATEPAQPDLVVPEAEPGPADDLMVPQLPADEEPAPTN